MKAAKSARRLAISPKNIEYAAEKYLIYGARWLLVPGYLMLVLCLAVLAFQCMAEFWQLLIETRPFQESATIAQILVILETVLAMNLILLCLLRGYTNFVSRISAEGAEDWPKWIGRVDYYGLKIYVLGSIVIISGVKLLQAFVAASDATGPIGEVEQLRLFWLVMIHLAFVGSVLILSIADRLRPRDMVPADEHGIVHHAERPAAAE